MNEDRCKHRLRTMGARELVRRRYQAGWPPDECSAPRGTYAACTVCLRIPGEDTP